MSVLEVYGGIDRTVSSVWESQVSWIILSMGFAMFCPKEGERVAKGTVATFCKVPRAKVPRELSIVTTRSVKFHQEIIISMAQRWKQRKNWNTDMRLFVFWSFITGWNSKWMQNWVLPLMINWMWIKPRGTSRCKLVETKNGHYHITTNSHSTI